MTPPLRRILPASIGRAVDARLISNFLDGHPEVDALVQAWANAYYTRFDGRIEGREHTLHAVGGQVAALLALVHPLVELVRVGLEQPTAGLVFTDAVTAAAAARLLAQSDRRADPDVAALAALLRGLGPALALMGDADAQLRWWREVRRATGKARISARDALFGADPACHVGTWILDHGGPAELATSVAGIPTQDRRLLSDGAEEVVDFAMSLSHALSATNGGPALSAWVDACPLPAQGAWSMVQACFIETTRLAQVLGLPVRPRPSLQVLAHRRGQLEDLSRPDELALFSELQGHLIHALRAQVTRIEIALTERGRIDPVTKLPTLQSFTEQLGRDFQSPDASPASLIAVDVLDFGQRFARDGIAESDRVLAKMAERLCQGARSDRVTRCGAATFIAIVPEGGRRARLIAERIRATLEGELGLALRTEVLDLQDAPREATAEALIHAVHGASRMPLTRTRRRVG